MTPLDASLVPYLRPAKAPLIGVISAALVQCLLVVAQAFAVAETIVAVVEGTSLHWPVTVVLAIAVCRALVGILADRFAVSAAVRVGSNIRHTLLSTCLERGPVWIAGKRTGELVALATRGAKAVEPYLTRYLPALVTAVVLPVVTLLAMASQDLLAAFIVLVTLPLLPLFAALIGITTKLKAERQWRYLAALAAHFLDVVRGLPTLVTYRRAQAQTRTIRTATQAHRQAALSTLRLSFASSAALELVATLSVALVAVSVGLRLDSGGLDLRTGLVVLLLAPEAYWPIRRVGAEFHAASEGSATFAAVTGIVGAEQADEEHIGDEPDRRHSAPGPDGAVAITVDRLSVSYPDSSAVALDLDHASFGPGGLTVVTGPSGAGKSTLLLTLLGHLSTSAGSIRVNGMAHGEISRDTWRSNVSWVPQRPWFAPGTIADNIRIGRGEATDPDLWAALRELGLADHVSRIPAGVDAQLDEDGRTLSAGQRARVAIARAIVANRPLTLLDEPTAHLDEETQATIVGALRRLSARSTVVVVSHREEVIAAADHVIEIAPPSGQGEQQESRPADADSATERSDAPLLDAVDVLEDADHLATETRRATPYKRLALAALLGGLATLCGVALTATSGWLIVRASEQPPVSTLLAAIVGVRTFGLGRPLFRYAERLISHDAALRLLADLRVHTYEALIPLTPGRLGRRRGDLLASVVDDVDAVVDRWLRVWLPASGFVVVAAVITAGTALVLPSSALVAVGVLAAAPVAFALARLAGGRIEREVLRTRSRLSSQVTDLLDGAGDVTVWAPLDQAVRPMKRADYELARASRQAAGRVALARALTTLVVGGGVASMAAVVGPEVASGGISAAVAALLILLPLGLAEPLITIAEAGALEPSTRQALSRLRALEDTPEPTPEPTHPVPAPIGLPALRLDSVAAGWGRGDVVAGVDLDLEPTRRVAVMGPSGSGKSTLAAVIARFIDPTSGSVTVAGIDVRDCATNDIRRTIGYVDDDPHVFGSTVYENVRLARPDASRSDVAEALSQAHLDRWLDGLDDGLDTLLGDGGIDVSGGERARIALARSVLSDHVILVLDEPTAHLDASTAREVVDDLLAVTSRRSVVMVTHREADTQTMDAVVHLT